MRIRTMVASLIALGVLAGCAGNPAAPASSSPPTVPAVDQSGSGVVRQSLQVELRSQTSDLHTVGPDGRRVFGWNLLVGPSTFLDEPVEVRLQGSVEYTDGSGPFDGFLRIVAADNSELAFYIDGQSFAGDPTELPARLEFIGANGRYALMVAAGQFNATRQDEVGAPVMAVIDLTVDTDGVAGSAQASPLALPSATDSARGSATAAPQ